MKKDNGCSTDGQGTISQLLSVCPCGPKWYTGAPVCQNAQQIKPGINQSLALFPGGGSVSAEWAPEEGGETPPWRSSGASAKLAGVL